MMQSLLLLCSLLSSVAGLHLLTSSTIAQSTLPASSDDGSDEDCSIPSPFLAQFVQPLTFPPFIDVSLTGVTIGAYKVSQKLHPDLPSTTLYAFGTSQTTAAFPGPTLMARQDMAAHVRWENHIPDEHHFLPQPPSIEWANPSQGGVPVVVHLHGAEVPSVYDGHPDAWITAKNETGPTFATQNYIYPNEQPAMALWYHDHTLGITRLNVLAGLAGMYIIRPSIEEAAALGLPDGAPLAIKDMRFYYNGSLRMPGPKDFNPTSWCPEWYDVWLVNGRAWPFVRVLAKPYRFRILNACNARFTALYINESSLIVPFLQIGTDGGFLPEPMEVNPYLLSSPGERADVIIDFSALVPGSEVVLRNAVVEPDAEPFYSNYTGPTSRIILKFIVAEWDTLQDGLIENSNGYLESLAAHIRRTARTESQLQLKQSQRYLFKGMGNDDHMDWKVDGGEDQYVLREVPMVAYMNSSGSIYQYTLGEGLVWDDPVDILPTLGSYEVWEVINGWMFAHNFHMHLLQFKVLNEQAIDVHSYVAKNCSMQIPYPQNGTCYTSYPQRPSFYNHGWKDTFSLFGSTLVRILVHFAPRDRTSFSFDATQGPGYVLHCHIVQHEDHSMMRPFVLLSSSNTTTL